MISYGSCDTEDWSNDAENSALHHRNKLHFKMCYNNKHYFILYCNDILKYIYFLLHFPCLSIFQCIFEIY